MTTVQFLTIEVFNIYKLTPKMVYVLFSQDKEENFNCDELE